jgi:putative phosphoesterase
VIRSIASLALAEEWSVARVGVISDTHGLLRPEAAALLRGSDFLIHAGDIGDSAILRDLAAIAPLTAVRGNNDKGRWAESIRETEVLRVEDVLIYVIHDLAQLDLDPAAAGFQVVVSGHSHRPSVNEKDGVVYLNPGSAGPRRFKLPIAVADLLVRGASVHAQITNLDDMTPKK